MARHITDRDEGGRTGPVGVVPVAADLRHLHSRQVAHREVEVGPGLGEQAALQRLGQPLHVRSHGSLGMGRADPFERLRALRGEGGDEVELVVGDDLPLALPGHRQAAEDATADLQREEGPRRAFGVGVDLLHDG